MVMSHRWPKIEIDLPDGIIEQWLRFTIELNSENPGEQELIKACNILLEYVAVPS